ncbi:Phosphoinositide phospholipase C [Gryllus bimaculatus]|nr:Phosphoinositide phospholipase C [Gryllus bimaculatus]
MNHFRSKNYNVPMSQIFSNPERVVLYLPLAHVSVRSKLNGICRSSSCVRMAQVPKAPQEVIEPPVSALYPSLVESPEFKEVIDHRSKTVEQILEILKKGTQLWKEANTVKHTRNGEQVLDADEFVSFYMKLMTRNDIKDIYTRYTKNKEMTVADLLDFIHKEQKGHTTTKEECLTLIEAFEQSNLKMEGKLSLIGFTNMLMSEQFDAFKQHHKVVYQDMHQPLSHYYIATSHNTGLLGWT